jgi:4-amino-4-deoxy-L-arabinose transferase-like glycosyltransferase
MKLDRLKIKKMYIVLLVLILLYLFVRLSVLFTTIKFIGSEECLAGTVAKELIDGPKYDIFEFQHIVAQINQGGLFQGVLVVPFFLLFGFSMFSLRLYLVFVSLIILIIVYLFLNKHFGLKSAVFAGLLMTFSPVVYIESNIIQGGPHLEAVLFTILVMYVFYLLCTYSMKYFLMIKRATSILDCSDW